MSNQEFENYLKLMGKLLQLNQAQQDLIGVELRDHLQSRMADLEELGVSTEEAFSRALEEFGDAAAMARNFQYVTQLKRRRWMMRLVTFSTAGVFLMFLLAMAMWPENSRFGAPERTMAKQEADEDSKVKHADEDPFGAGPVVGSSRSDAPTQARPTIDQNDEVETILNQVAELQFEETPWVEVRKYLEERFNINIVTDTSAVDDSLSEEEPIRFQMKHSLEVCLHELLLYKNATFIVKDGIVRVISLDFAEDPKFLTTRIFDCQQVVNALNTQTSSYSSFSESSEKSRPEIPGSPGGATPVSSSSKPKSVPFVSKQALLVHLVTNNTYSLKWSQNGGPFSIEVVNGNLMVTASREAHKNVELLLDTMARKIQVK